MSQSAINRWIPVLTISIGGFTSLLSSTTIEVAFPNLMSAFGIDLKTAQWTVTLYMIVMTLAMLMAADLVKRFGVKQVSIVSFVLFIIGTWVGGSATTVSELLIGRTLQGFSAGLQAPLAAIVVANSFPKDRIGTAMGIYGLIMLMAPAVGPVAGGLLIDAFQWPMLFYFQIPFAAVSAVLAYNFLPDDNQTSGNGQYDWVGLLLLTLFISSIFFSISYMTEESTAYLWLPVLILAPLLLLVIFVFVENRVSNPLVNTELFKVAPFSINLVVIFLLSSGMFSTILLVPLYMIETLHMTPGTAGLALLPAGLAMAVASPLAGRLSDKYSPIVIVFPGLLLFAFASFYLSTYELGASLNVIIMSSVLGRLGLSILLPSLYSSSFRVLDGKFTEYASSMLNFARQIGASIGILMFSGYYSISSYKNSENIMDNLREDGGEFLEYGKNLSMEIEKYSLVSWRVDSVVKGEINQYVNQISEHIAFIDAFFTIAIITLASSIIWLISFLLMKFK